MIVHNKFVFLHLQKCAGSFTEDFLLKAFKGESKYVSPRHNPLKVKPKNKFVLGNIRNPWDWYVSWWAANKKGPGPFYKYAKDGFSNFVQRVMTADDRRHDVDFKLMRSQDIGALTYRYQKVYEIHPDFICKVENLKSEIKQCFKEFNLPFSKKQMSWFEQSRENKSSHKHYSTYYDSESIELIRHKDRYIIEKYGYEWA